MIPASSGGLCSYVPDVIVKHVAVSDKSDLVLGVTFPNGRKISQSITDRQFCFLKRSESILRN